MTKSNKYLIAGAAIAGLLAGTGARIQASNLLPGVKSSFSAQDQSADDKAADKKASKDKHACQGKNSCKGKGGCATDGSKMPDEKKPG